MQSAIEISINERLGVDRSLRRFKRLCESYGVIREYRRRQEYKKPSVRRLEKSQAAERRRKKMVFKSLRFRSNI